LLVHIHEHLGPKQPDHVPDSIVGECRAPISQAVALEVFLSYIPNGADALFTTIFNSVEALLQFPSAILFGLLGNRFRGSLCRLLQAASREPKLIPPGFSPFED